jgi:essential nuclear protein 1
MPKVDNKKKLKHDPLHKQILDSVQVTDKRKKNQKYVKEEELDEFEEYLDTKMSNKILQQASKQEDEYSSSDDDDEEVMMDEQQQAEKKLTVNDLHFKEEDAQNSANYHDSHDDDTTHLSSADAQTLDFFLGGSTTHQQQQKSYNLSEIILDKIREKESQQGSSGVSRSERDVQEKLHPKVVSTYKKLGIVLSKYTSGPLPKAFKVIPNLSNWEEIVFLTNPEKWSNPALYEATRIFIALLDPKNAQKYLSMILLPKFRESLQNSIDRSKKVNHHVYQSLMKSCYRAPAFFKGIVLPLCESGDCSPTEANVIGSVIKKAKLPNLHACACLYKLAQMEFSPATLYFIKILVAKRYALPSQVVEVMVEYFHQFITVPSLIQTQLHVIWHQTLLMFVQLYKKDFTSQQKNKIYNICKKRTHPQITPEIRKELNRTTTTTTSTPSTTMMEDEE